MRPASAQDFVGSSEDAPPAARRPQSSIGFRPNDYEDYEDETDHTPLFEMLAPRGSLMTPSRLRPHSAAAVLQETVRPIRQEDKRRSRLLYIAPAPDFGQGSSFDYFSGVGDVTRVLNDRIKELNESLEPSAPRRGWAEQKGAQEEEEDPVILAAFRRKQAQAAFDATYLASLQALQIARGGGPSAALEAARLEIARKKEKKEDEKQASKPQPSLAMKQAASGASKFSLKGTAQKIANMTAAKHSIRGIALDAVTALHTFDRGRDKTRSKTRAFVNERLMEKVAVYRGDSHKREELKERCEWHVAMAKKQHPESAIKRNIKKAVAWGQEEWEMQQRIKDRRERLVIPLSLARATCQCANNILCPRVISSAFSRARAKPALWSFRHCRAQLSRWLTSSRTCPVLLPHKRTRVPGSAQWRAASAQHLTRSAARRHSMRWRSSGGWRWKRRKKSANAAERCERLLPRPRPPSPPPSTLPSPPAPAVSPQPAPPPILFARQALLPGGKEAAQKEEEEESGTRMRRSSGKHSPRSR